MINNYELLILNYIFNALHDFNSPYSINIGLALINLKQNRKVPIKGTSWELWGVYICLWMAPPSGDKVIAQGMLVISHRNLGWDGLGEWEMDVNPFVSWIAWEENKEETELEAEPQNSLYWD